MTDPTDAQPAHAAADPTPAGPPPAPGAAPSGSPAWAPPAPPAPDAYANPAANVHPDAYATAAPTGAPAPATPQDGGVGFAVPATPVATTPPATRQASGGWGKWLFIMLIPVIAVVTFAGGVAAGRTELFGPVAIESPTAAPPATAQTELDLIEEAWRAINDNYVDAKNLDKQELAYGAIKGMTEAVGDEGHTVFMTADEAKAMDQSLSGTFVGIGVQVKDDDGPVIGSVIPNTPASESGKLQRGDRIVAVDGWKTEGHTVDEVVAKVRGPEGQPVTLTIGRAGTADFDVTITRRQFDLPLVSWTMVPGQDMAVVRLEQFATGATDGVKKAIQEAKDAGAKGIIFDLRGNPGGFVNEAIGVASQFVGDGTVYQSQDASGKTKDVPVEEGGVYTDGPLVVLADGESASSAEIVTGAIQDAKRGVVVGTKTFGTGTVLGRFDLSDGSVMRIGVERWLTRGGRPIWHEGLEPDVKVDLPSTAAYLIPDEMRDLSTADLAKTPDVQILRAIEELRSIGG